MRALVLTGPLAWPPLMRVVLGRDAADDCSAATVPDAAIAADDLCFPPLVPVAGARTDALLLEDDTGNAFERLSFFASALGQSPVPRHVETAAGRMAALAFMAEGAAHPPQSGWQAKGWAARWGAIACAAATEIMEHFDKTDPYALTARMPMILSRAVARAKAAAAPAPAQVRSDMDGAQVETKSCRASHDGFYLTRVCKLRHPTFAGGLSPVLTREVFVATDAALVLPYDPVRDRLLLVEQFRMGPYGRGDPRPFVLEPVAGHVDAGETPEDAARREAQEEAGLTLRALEHISSHYCSPGCSTEFFHCYLGLADLAQAGQGRGGLADENEDIRTHVLDFDQAMALIGTGEINIGPLVLMLLWLQRERARLRAAG
ncbi:NUDIX domain-containing protein [Roseovarius amoyensis]|uniref:NUDIX domain-containing protein n=1 Tax=Roseovarius amoyensis TaxID=2211448 RepID=UPI000DBE636B|nr:NUDIX domain-containing protein [Roseovarius amoyensis]